MKPDTKMLKNKVDNSKIFLRTYQYDRLIVIIVTLTSVILSIKLDLFETLVQSTRVLEHVEIDEIIPSLFVLTLALIWYSFRRRKELQNNIEKQKELEHSLLELTTNLEEKVKVRTEELIKINTELEDEIKRRKQAEEKKIKSEKLKSIIEMAGTICHELNQPLQSISGNAELILMNPPDDTPLLKRVATIKDQVDRSSEIITKLVAITKYQTKNYPGDIQIIDIDQASNNSFDKADTK